MIGGLPQESTGARQDIRLPVYSRVLSGVIDFSRRKPLGAIGGGILLTLVLIAIFSPLISPHDPYQIRGNAILQAPGSEFWLGADSLGRDVLSRLFYGGRISLYVGLVSIAIGITAGSFLGAVSAYFGGKVDLIVQRFVDAFIAFPASSWGWPSWQCWDHR